MKLGSKFILLIVILTVGIVTAQVSTGMPPFASVGGGPFDTVNLGNLNVHFAIPILHKSGRMPFSYDLSYDSSVWTPQSVNGVMTWVADSNWGWRGWTEAAVGYYSYSLIKTVSCRPLEGSYRQWGNYVYHDTFGVSHPYSDTVWIDCNGNFNGFTDVASDGSGYTMTVEQSPSDVTMTLPGGQIRRPSNFRSGTTGTKTDANGNQITLSSDGTQFFDTLSSTTPVLKLSSPAPPASTTFTYTAPSGGNATYSMNYTLYTVKTKFGITGVSGEYGPLSNALVSSITLPDGSSFTFAYEKTPGTCTPLSGTYSANCVTGRIASVSLPTGGTITYAYSGGSNGIESDGSTAGLTRTLNPGGAWQYSRALQSGSKPVGPGSTWTTTVVDPSGNYTVIKSAEDASTNTSNTVATYNFYETQRQVYQGSISPSNLLLTTFNCWNNNFNSCSTQTVSSPITKLDHYRSPTGVANPAVSETLYNNFGLVTEDKEIDFVAAPNGSPYLSDTYITYASLGNGIVNRVASVTVNGPDGKPVATTNYYYDQTAVTATSGTPQHVAVTGSRGNLTTISYTVSGSTTLSKSFTYYDTGTPHVATDVNGAQTTYLYASGSCGNSFPTTIQEPMSLSRSITWNCTGAVATQVTDENGNNVKTDYTDPHFWRPADVFDQANNETTVAYISPTETETTLSFNSGNSVSDKRITLDGFGRPMYTQNKQGPGASNYDTVQTAYDAVGNIPWITLPCSASASSYCPPGQSPANGFGYDALKRVTSSTDSGGRQTTYQYTANDELVTFGPTPVGENAKQRQFEYDGLGRLTSVCEITAGTTAWPGGNCSQTNPQTGYWTKYTYNAIGNLLSVTQNAQGTSQSRTFVYDMLGRMTSETNPESGTTSYVYDSDTTGDVCGNGRTPSAGLLMKVSHNDGSYLCYDYDSLGRVVAIGTSNQSGNSPARRFRYDSTGGSAAGCNLPQPTGYVGNNLKGRLVEAETDTTSGQCGGTDEWFSYDVRGESTDAWEFTPHSGGYYHTTAAYWATGTLQTLSRIPGVPTLNYGANGPGLDGEGRITQVTASSGTNPVSGVSYVTANGTGEPVGALIGVNFGSGDSDSFTYDPNTGRMNGYTFFVNGKTDTGTLYWNANATLQKLVVNDQIPSTSDSQTCNYLYDDLQRLSTGNCGVLWTQNFSYDPFGNITKSVPTGANGLTFAPLYSTGNQFTSIPGVSVKYDGNGNLLTDNLNTYTWDAYGDMVTVSTGSATVTNTYDALGRMVENNAGGSYTEFVYDPTGTKVANCNGQSLIKALIALPGGAKAIYNSTGLAYFRHSDWLGSSRLASTATMPTQAYSSSAYAPFGEQYATSGSADASYTGQDQNTVPSLYDLWFRRQSPSQGRWISPDPAGFAAADSMSPQSWNRYAFVLNNPLSLIDPSGLDCNGEDADDDGCPLSDDNSGGGQPPIIGGDPNTPPLPTPCDGSNCNDLPSGNPGGDCGGPCVPFTYQNSIGCTTSVSYDTVSYNGATWSEPYTSMSCLGGLVGFGDMPATNGSLMWLGRYAKNLFSLKNFVAEFKDGGCVAVFMDEMAGSADSTMAGQDEAIKATAQSGAYVAATAYAANQGLVVPMRSSIVRGILDVGEAGGEAIALGATIYDEGKGLANEVKSFQSGECQ